MKIGITSLGIYGTHDNYGAILQIWAFKEYLKRNFDADVEVINYSGLSCDRLYSRPKKNIIKKIYREFKSFFDGSFLLKKRYRRNEEFISNNFALSPAYDVRTIKDAIFDYDVFIAESDVIWDPTFRNTGFDNVYFLNLPNMKKSGKRLVYAASMGDIKYSERDNKIFLDKIKDIDAWSVREIYARKYVQDTFNLDCECLLDPTLLLDEEDYTHFLNDKYSKSKYVLVYMPAEKNDKMIKAAKKYAHKYNLSVKYIIRTSKQHFMSNVYLDLGIEDFLSIIKSADVVFCDSFHAICFSIIFKKQFFAFLRDDGKKVVDICQRFNLQDRVVDNNLNDEIKDIDYNLVYNQYLWIEKNRSEQWLRENIYL